jgi:hypothetical protein
VGIFHQLIEMYLSEVVPPNAPHNHHAFIKSHQSSINLSNLLHPQNIHQKLVTLLVFNALKSNSTKFVDEKRAGILFTLLVSILSKIISFKAVIHPKALAIFHTKIVLVTLIFLNLEVVHS